METEWKWNSRSHSHSHSHSHSAFGCVWPFYVCSKNMKSYGSLVHILHKGNTKRCGSSVHVFSHFMGSYVACDVEGDKCTPPSPLSCETSWPLGQNKVGHVTKAGDIAGPRVLEHIVDVVLYMEGEALHPHRLIRPVKNRFGSTNELGVLEMSRTGLQAVSNPTLLYVAGRNFEQQVPVGSTFTVVIDGSRPFLVETQALCSVGGEGRQCLGVEAKRVDMIIAVLTKQVGIPLDRGVLFMNAVGGVTLSETVGDLAIAVSICSSYFEKPVPCGMSFLGEIGLGGELRTATMMAKRVHELAKLRFKSCIVPDASINSLSLEGCVDFSVIGHNSLRSVIRDIFDVEF